jgi:DNA-binding GntR family transcriptional regulator
MATWTRLQQELAERILQMMREDDLQAGAWLNENGTAKQLNVSRTPVRGAFSYLAEQGVVRRHPNKGIEILRVPQEPAPGGAGTADIIDLAMVKISHDRHEGLIEDEISEMEVMRRYDLGRLDVQKLLARLADLDMVERKPGYGWRFMHGPRDSSAHEERYRFRMLLEPAGMLEESFKLDPAWAEDMRARHLATLERPWRDSSAIGFYEMNAAFHEGLAAASGNRYIHSAIKRQNELRRLSNYDWTYGFERVKVNCAEHLQMLDHLEAGDNELASILMRRHLQRASKLRSGGKDG